MQNANGVSDSRNPENKYAPCYTFGLINFKCPLLFEMCIFPESEFEKTGETQATQ